MSAVITNRSTLSSSWRRALPPLALLLLALLALYIQSITSMVQIWERSGTFAHAYLVAPISLWLIWRRRHLLAVLAPQPQSLWLLPMAVVAAAWLVGELAGVNALTQGAATALIVMAVPAVLGNRVAREIAFPLGFLFFMVPFGEFLMPVMMESTADFTVAAVALSGVPVYREGMQFIIPSGAWSVVEACSGIRYLIASFMVGTLFAYLNYRSMRRRAAFWLVALAVPVVANWLRAYMIVMLGHLSGNTLAVGVDHLVYGWVFFGMVIGVMFFIGSRWSQPDDDLGAPAAGAPPVPVHAGAGLAPAWVALAAIALAAAPHGVAWQFEHGAAGPALTLALPDLPDVPKSKDAPAHTPLFEGPAAQASGVYASGAGAVTVHVAYYRRQHFGHKLVSSENTLVKSDDREWNRSASGGTSITVGDRQVGLRTAELRTVNAPGRDRQRRLEVRQILWVGGRLTTSDHLAAGLGVLNRLAGRGDDAAAINFYLPGAAEDGTGAKLDAFIARHLPAFEASLAATQAQR